MYGHVEIRAIGLLLLEASGSSELRSKLSSPNVAWLIEQELVNDEGRLTGRGRKLATFVKSAVEFQLAPREVSTDGGKDA